MESEAMTRGQMADGYGICVRTFNSLLKKNGIEIPKGLICPKDQERIFLKIGFPKNLGRKKRKN
jgi:hypothetical protein